MSVSPFKDRFSLSWLASPSETTQPNPNSPEQLPPGAEAVFSSVGNQVLSSLHAQPGNTSTLLNLASASSMRLEALLPVIQYLVSKGWVERVAEDPSGNDSYTITQAGLAPRR